MTAFYLSVFVTNTVHGVLPEKIIVTEFVKNFPVFYGTCKFITVLT